MRAARSSARTPRHAIWRSGLRSVYFQASSLRVGKPASAKRAAASARSDPTRESPAPGSAGFTASKFSTKLSTSLPRLSLASVGAAQAAASA